MSGLVIVSHGIGIKDSLSVLLKRGLSVYHLLRLIFVSTTLK